ncbi:MAG TPA: hypothetical protein VF458_10010, partial [Ktedonobacteraceae bacterium]
DFPGETGPEQGGSTALLWPCFARKIDPCWILNARRLVAGADIMSLCQKYLTGNTPSPESGRTHDSRSLQVNIIQRGMRSILYVNINIPQLN